MSGRQSMDPRELLRVVLDGDALAARQWVRDAESAEFQWSQVPPFESGDRTELAVYAGLLELLAERHGARPPSWTSQVGPAPRPVLLVKAAEKSNRMRVRLEKESPEPLRRRSVLAPPDYLKTA
jgi:hypothetical protein